MINFDKNGVSVNIEEILTECEKYRKQLIKYCAQFFDYDYEYAEDCVQNAYLALIENLYNGVEIRNYKSWLYKVVLNQKNKVLRDKIKRNELDFFDNKEKDEFLNDAVYYEPDFVENMVSEETIEKVALKIISTLSKDERQLYYLYYYEHKKLREIANEMNISYSAVRQRHVELRKKIKRLIGEYEINIF